MLAVVAVALAVRDRVGGAAAAGALPAAPAMAAATALHIVANLVLVEAWRGIVGLVGPRLPYGVAAWVWGASQLARYAVGGAQVGSRALVGRRHDLSGAVGAVTTLVEVVWQIAIAGAIVLATLPWWAGHGFDALAWLAAAPVLGLVAALAAPQTVLRPAAATLRRVPVVGRRVPPPDAPALAAVTRRAVAVFTALQLLNTSLRLIALLVLFAAVGGDLSADGARAVGADAVGQFAGRVVVVAPGGVGPREGATGLLLAPVLGTAGAIVLVAAARLVEILAELLFLGAARALRTRARRPAAASVTGGRTDPTDTST